MLHLIAPAARRRNYALTQLACSAIRHFKRIRDATSTRAARSGRYSRTPRRHAASAPGARWRFRRVVTMLRVFFSAGARRKTL